MPKHLQSQSKEDIQKMVFLLNERGYILDEELTMGTMPFKSWSKEYTEILKEFGYKGGRLLNGGKYYNMLHGQLYYLIDLNKHNLQSIVEVCNEWVETNAH